jgi:hypothetical protein
MPSNYLFEARPIVISLKASNNFLLLASDFPEDIWVPTDLLIQLARRFLR